MEKGEMDLATLGLLLAFILYFYSSVAGDIKNFYWLAPLLTILIFFTCWLLARPQKYFLGDLMIYFGTGIIIFSISYLGKLDFTYSFYFFIYLAVALIACFFTYFNFNDLSQVTKTSLKSLERLRRPMILFLVFACIISFLYFNNIIWNWGSEEGEVNIKAFQTLLQGSSPYGKLINIEYAWSKGDVVPYSYFPVTLLYYGLFLAFPTSPISAVFNFSNLKVGTMLATVVATILLFKIFKELGDESLGRFLSILYLLLFGFEWGGLDYIHNVTVFFIILTFYFLATGKERLSLVSAGLTALTQPLGTLFSIFVIVHIIRKMKSRIFNWKNMLALAPLAIMLLTFFFWDWQGFCYSIFGWWSASYGNVGGTYHGTSSVANLTYFFNPVIEVIGGKLFFIIKVIAMLLLGMLLSLKYTKTITKTIFSATVFISTWIFLVNSWISIMYLQESIVTSLLLIGVLVIYGRRQ